MKIVPFLSLLDQLRIFHWQTSSYAEHKALGKSYETLSDLFDRFIEIYYGKYGKPLVAVDYNIVAESYNSETDVSKIIGNKKRNLLSYMRNELVSDNDKDLLNITDEIEGELNHLQYLLTLK